MVDYLNQPLARFLDDAGAKRASPGGGSVAALAAALGVALGEMAANYSASRGDEATRNTVAALLDKLQRTSAALRQLVGEDMEAYERFASARKLSADTPDREAQVRAAASVATLVPLETVALAAAALDVMSELRPVCNTYLVSDLRAGAILAEAAARAAAENVRINLPDLPEEDAREFETRLDALLGRAAETASKLTQ